MNLYLVRHGEASATWGQCSDPGLSELGAQQAQECAEQLGPQLDGATHLVSSPLARARETAEPLAQSLQLLVRVDDAFKEIPAPVPLPQRQDWLRSFMQQRWDEQDDSMHQWRDRAFGQVMGFEQPTVVFTHFLVINAVVGKVLDRAETLCFWPDNVSVTHLRRTGDGLELVALGRQMKTVVN